MCNIENIDDTPKIILKIVNSTHKWTMNEALIFFKIRIVLKKSITTETVFTKREMHINFLKNTMNV